MHVLMYLNGYSLHPTCRFLFYGLFSFLECHADKASNGSLEAE
jgi:hypothetical protein